MAQVYLDFDAKAYGQGDSHVLSEEKRMWTQRLRRNTTYEVHGALMYKWRLFGEVSMRFLQCSQCPTSWTCRGGDR